MKPFANARLIIWVIIALVALSGPQTMLARQSNSAMNQPVSDSLQVERQVSPPTLGSDQTSTVELRLSGRDLPACQGIPGLPVDLMFVFDISASAGTGPGSNWERTVALTLALLNYLNRPIYLNPNTSELSQVGIISTQTGPLGPESVVLQGLSQDYALLQTLIDSLVVGGDTDLAGGLRLAAQELAQSALSSNRTQAVVLMLHDNTALDESTENAVEEVQDQGIPVYLVSNHLNIATEKQISQSAARNLVQDRYFLDPEPADLFELFIRATEGNTDLAAAQIQVIETVSPAESVELSNVRGPGGQREAGRVLWDVGTVELDETETLYYDLRLYPDASGQITFTNSVVWLDCNGQPQKISGGTSDQIPTAEPATLPPSETLVPTSSEPTSPAANTPAPTDKPDEEEGGVLAIIGIPWYCWLLPLLLLLALLIFWWWRRNQKPAPAPQRVRPRRRVGPERELTWDDGRKKGPMGVDVRHGLLTETISDKQGRQLKMRIRPEPRKLQSDLQAHHEASVHIWIEDEAEREIGRLKMNLALTRRSDPFTEHSKQWCDAQLDMADFAGLAQEPDLAARVIKRAEALAQQNGAKELVVKLASGQDRSLFARYQVRQDSSGERELFKEL